MAFIALMAGALFYAARIPVEVQAPESDVVATPADADAPVFPSFKLTDIDGVERDFSEWQGKARYCVWMPATINLSRNTTEAWNNPVSCGKK